MKTTKRAKRPRKVRSATLAEVRDRILADPETRFYYDQIQVQRKIGEMLAQSRQAAHLSQRQLAVKAKTTQPVIARLEAGRSGIPSFALLHRIAAAIGLEVSVAFRPRSAA
jgi:ribosome-binding protein aMBF1 (putative translation factor)